MATGSVAPQFKRAVAEAVLEDSSHKAHLCWRSAPAGERMTAITATIAARTAAITVPNGARWRIDGAGISLVGTSPRGQLTKRRTLGDRFNILDFLAGNHIKAIHTNMLTIKIGRRCKDSIINP